MFYCQQNLSFVPALCTVRVMLQRYKPQLTSVKDSQFEYRKIHV
jgi:hypothetical protein